MRRDTLVFVLLGLAIALLVWVGPDADARGDLRGLGTLLGEAAAQIWRSWFG